ncbi:MAG: hypothetical protein HS107_04135 [Thermoflexaceae bacterium]|nr:hypothetical protein [Thermoflexaceae bacterium]
MATPDPDRRNIDAAREVALQFRALTGIGDDHNPSVAWTDTIADLVTALHHLADIEVGEYGFDGCLDRAAFDYAYDLRPDEDGEA